MGQENINAAGLSEGSQIIDFLYIDKERADSFISQMRNGTLRSVTKNIGTSEDFVAAAKGSVAVASADISRKTQSSTSAAEQYDPYHSQLIQLLEDLDIAPLATLAGPCEGQLVLLKTPISIRDLATIKTIFPFMLKNEKLFGGTLDKNTKAALRAMGDLLQALPDSITISAKFDGTNITGTLKESGLTIRQTDLMKTYGANIPGEWYTLGIMDSTIEATQNGVNTFEDAIDLCSMAMSSIYSSSLYKIIPILIFRPVVQKG